MHRMINIQPNFFYGTRRSVIVQGMQQIGHCAFWVRRIVSTNGARLNTCDELLHVCDTTGKVTGSWV